MIAGFRTAPSCFFPSEGANPALDFGGAACYQLRPAMISRIALSFLLLTLSLHAASEPPPADVVPHAGLSPQEAATKATLPKGFKMHVFASEPEVVQPIAFCLDD